MPQTVMASIYHELNHQWALLGNVGWQDWSNFGNIDVSVASANPPTVFTVDADYKDTWHGRWACSTSRSPNGCCPAAWRMTAP